MMKKQLVGNLDTVLIDSLDVLKFLDCGDLVEGTKGRGKSRLWVEFFNKRVSWLADTVLKKMFFFFQAMPIMAGFF
jgi:hypothetical protein